MTVKIKGAGILTAADFQRRKNDIQASRAAYVRQTQTVSDCCTAAVVYNSFGDQICADCLDACDTVKIGGRQ